MMGDMLQGLYRQMQDDAKKKGGRYSRVRDVGELRRALGRARDGMCAQTRRRNASNICHLLRKVLSRTSYGTLLVYAPHRSEVDLTEVVRELLPVKKVFLPKVTGKDSMRAFRIRNFDEDLEVGAFGIREPRTTDALPEGESIDVAVVTGLGFNEAKCRLGYGKGFYDRFFERCRVALKIGCFFEEQFVGHWEAKPHDIPMNLIITEDRLYD